MEPRFLQPCKSEFVRVNNNVKKNLSIFFLVILSLPAFYQVSFLTFYQLNKDFIAENYCINKERPITMCYGKCFLEKGLGLTDQTPNPYSLVAQLRFEMQEFLVENFEIGGSLPAENLRFSIFQTPSVSDGVFSSLFRPPLV